MRGSPPSTAALRQRDQGANVVLTIDEKLQYIRERNWRRHRENSRLAGPVIVPNRTWSDSAAGELAKNSIPIRECGKDRRTNGSRRDSANLRTGSTFKLITLAAAFDQDLTKPEEIFDCENGRCCSRPSHSDHKTRSDLLTVSEISVKSQRQLGRSRLPCAGSAEILRL